MLRNVHKTERQRERGREKESPAASQVSTFLATTVPHNMCIQPDIVGIVGLFD